MLWRIRETHEIEEPASVSRTELVREISARLYREGMRSTIDTEGGRIDFRGRSLFVAGWDLWGTVRTARMQVQSDAEAVSYDLDMRGHYLFTLGLVTFMIVFQNVFWMSSSVPIQPRVGSACFLLVGWHVVILVGHWLLRTRARRLIEESVEAIRE